jgi:competence protein ComEA
MRFKVCRVVTALVAGVVLTTAQPLLGHATDADHRIDINGASVAELATLPGIGQAKAKAIVEYRAADPFKTIEDLQKVKGIGEKTLGVLRPRITVGADAATE